MFLINVIRFSLLTMPMNQHLRTWYYIHIQAGIGVSLARSRLVQMSSLMKAHASETQFPKC